MPESINQLIQIKRIDDEISLQDIEEYIGEIKETFKDGFQVHDIAKITFQTIEFTCQFVNTTLDEKKQTAKDIVDELIESISIPFIPENFSDTILKALADGFIDVSVDVIEDSSIF